MLILFVVKNFRICHFFNVYRICIYFWFIFYLITAYRFQKLIKLSQFILMNGINQIFVFILNFTHLHILSNCIFLFICIYHFVFIYFSISILFYNIITLLKVVKPIKNVFCLWFLLLNLIHLLLSNNSWPTFICLFGV